MSSVDLLVIGGGITGAGIALEAARRGVDVLLVEARDFAWGASSRSSKLVHGGLRYLRQGDFALTRESVRERAQLLHDAPGLVEPQRFLFGHYAGRAPGRWLMGLGLAVYDAMAHQHSRTFHSADDALRLAPHTARTGLRGASSYLDASTDDARLVLRVLHEAEHFGARVVNAAAARSLLHDAGGAVYGARIDGAGFSGEVSARCVVNATGAWADALRRDVGAAPRLRPLRGSHLVFPLWRLPVAQSVSLLHPRDGRPVFATPWEGVALVGTTDLDHTDDLDLEPGITPAEVTYLLEALDCAFPALRLGAADAIGSWAGVRPVVAGATGEPSRQTREHVVLEEHGLISVTGGKLTTFRAIALDALRHAAPRLPGSARPGAGAGTAPIFAPLQTGPALQSLPPPLAARLLGRYGRDAEALVTEAPAGALRPLPGTPTLGAELLWAARHEQVRHLDDLMLRRTRLGLLLRDGAAELLPHWQAPLCAALGWTAARWQIECVRYRDIIERCYSLPRSALATAASRVAASAGIAAGAAAPELSARP